MSKHDDAEELHNHVVQGIIGIDANPTTALESLNTILTKADVLAATELPTKELVLMALTNFNQSDEVITTGLNILHALLLGPAMDDDDEISSLVDLLFRLMASNLTVPAIISRIFAVFCLMLEKYELHAQLYSSLKKAIPVILEHNADNEDTINAVAYFLYLIFKKLEDISDFENNGIIEAIMKHCATYPNSSMIMVLVGYMVIYDHGSLANLAPNALAIVKTYMSNHYDSWFAIRAINFLLEGEIPNEVLANNGPDQLLKNLRQPGPEESDQKLLRESCRFFKILHEQGLLTNRDKVAEVAKSTLFKGTTYLSDDVDLKWYFVMFRRIIPLLETLNEKISADDFKKMLYGTENNGLLASLDNCVGFLGDFDAALDTLLFLSQNTLTIRHLKDEKAIIEFIKKHTSLYPVVEYKTVELQRILEAN